MIPTNVKKKTALIIVNFGGPRSLDEISAFLQALLCDRDVVRTKLPGFLHQYLFSKIAKKRAKKISGEYTNIGGKSPIYEATEQVASGLRRLLPYPIYTFHRYLPATHPSFIRKIVLADIDEWLIFPMFPQFSYATSGSIARFLDQRLPKSIVRSIYWLKSYPDQKAYTDLFTVRIRTFLKENDLQEEETLLFFSAHGVPQKFIDEGDPYQRECERSYAAITSNFSKAQSLLAYQSKFGPGEWIKPYTVEVCRKIEEHAKNAKNVLFIPLAFTSDHIETLHEIENEYLPLVTEKGYKAYRLPAFNDQADWIQTIAQLINEPNSLVSNQMLIRYR